MIGVLILICGAYGPCDRLTARDAFEITPANSLVECMLAGQAYAAQTAMVREEDRVKVLCEMGRVR